MFHWLSRLLGRPQPVYNVEQALRDMYRKGVTEGMKKIPPTVYHRSCDRHHIRLHASTQPGIFLCPLCQTDPSIAVPPPIWERKTGPLPRVPPGALSRFYKSYERMNGAPPGKHTLAVGAVQLQQKEARRAVWPPVPCVHKVPPSPLETSRVHKH